MVLTIAPVGFCQDLEDGWKGIKPLKTHVSTVKKLLGDPRIDENGFHFYKTGEDFVRADYLTAPCSSDETRPFSYRGRYNLPEGTVLDYYVTFYSNVLLSDLKLDLTKYHRDTSGDVINFVTYRGKNGLSVSVTIMPDGLEYVRKLTYEARSTDNEIAKCPTPK